MITSAIKNNHTIKKFAIREVHFEEPLCYFPEQTDNMGRYKPHPQPLIGCHKVDQFYTPIERSKMLTMINKSSCACKCKK